MAPPRRGNRPLGRSWPSGVLSAARALVAASMVAAALITRAVAQTPNIAPVRIDCGNTGGSGTTVGRLAYGPDTYFTDGAAATNPYAHLDGLAPLYTSLRIFSGGAGGGGCYQVPVPSGRYLVRAAFAYDNYDGLEAFPVFTVQLEGTTAQLIDTAALNTTYGTAPFATDFLVFVTDGNASICFVPQTGSPFVNALEVLPVEYGSYNNTDVPLGTDVILSNLLRINCGGPEVGELQDYGSRVWAADPQPLTPPGGVISTTNSIAAANVAPDLWPPTIFQTARQGLLPVANSSVGYEFPVTPVDPSNLWYIRWYFAEIDPSAKPNQRLFYLLIGSSGALGDPFGNATFDLLAHNAVYQALDLPLNFSYAGAVATGAPQDFAFALVAAENATRPPLLSAFEVYEIIPTGDPSRGKHSGDGLSGWAVALIVIAAVLLAAALAAAFLLWRRRRAGGGDPPTLGVGSLRSSTSFRDRAGLLFSPRGGSQEADGVTAAARQAPYQRSDGGEFTDVELTEPSPHRRV